MSDRLSGKEFRRRRHSRNIALLVVLTAFVGMIFAVTIVKTRIAEQRTHLLAD